MGGSAWVLKRVTFENNDGSLLNTSGFARGTPHPLRHALVFFLPRRFSRRVFAAIAAPRLHHGSSPSDSEKSSSTTSVFSQACLYQVRVASVPTPLLSSLVFSLRATQLYCTLRLKSWSLELVPTYRSSLLYLSSARRFIKDTRFPPDAAFKRLQRLGSPFGRRPNFATVRESRSYIKQSCFRFHG